MDYESLSNKELSGVINECKRILSRRGVEDYAVSYIDSGFSGGPVASSMSSIQGRKKLIILNNRDRAKELIEKMYTSKNRIDKKIEAFCSDQIFDETVDGFKSRNYYE